MSYWTGMDSSKPWRAVVQYRRSAYLAGYYDTAEDAQRDAEYAARMRSEDDVAYLEIDHKNGETWKQLWYGRKPLGAWCKKRECHSTVHGANERSSEGSR